MELRQLRYFVTVAEEGGFGRAAERLGIVQSAVSTQVRRLERQLGVALFDRSTRRVALSGAGELLLPQARTVLAAAEHTRGLAAAIAAGTAGLLRLGAVHGPGDRMNRLLRRLAEGEGEGGGVGGGGHGGVGGGGHGGFRTVLRHLPAGERLHAVRTGGLDAAFVRGAATAHPGLDLLPVWTDPLYAALPAHHSAAAAPELTLAQLAALPLRLAARERNPPFHALVTAALRDAGAAPPEGPPFTGLRETLTALGTGPEPSWTVFYEVTGLPELPGVAVRPLRAPALTTWLAVPPGPPSPALRRLLAACAAPEVGGADS